MKVVPIGKAAPDETVVSMCRDLLARAEEGEIRSIMYISELRDGNLETRYSACEDLFRLAGQVARLAHKVQQRIDDASTAVE